MYHHHTYGPAVLMSFYSRPFAYTAVGEAVHVTAQPTHPHQHHRYRIAIGAPHQYLSHSPRDPDMSNSYYSHRETPNYSCVRSFENPVLSPCNVSKSATRRSLDNSPIRSSDDRKYIGSALYDGRGRVSSRRLALESSASAGYSPGTEDMQDVRKEYGNESNTSRPTGADASGGGISKENLHKPRHQPDGSPGERRRRLQ
jgi:hypothetical protein